MVEDLKGKVEVLIIAHHPNEVLGPGFDLGCDGLGFQKGGLWVPANEMVELWAVSEGMSSGASRGGSRTNFVDEQQGLSVAEKTMDMIFLINIFLMLYNIFYVLIIIKRLYFFYNFITT